MEDKHCCEIWQVGPWSHGERSERALKTGPVDPRAIPAAAEVHCNPKSPLTTDFKTFRIKWIEILERGKTATPETTSDGSNG